MTADQSRPWLAAGDDFAAERGDEGIPAALPQSQTATYNPALHASRPGRRIEPASAAPWRVRRGDSTQDEAADAPFAASDSETSRLRPGYTLHRVIAAGGFGEIWEATQECLGRTVAVKRLRQSLIDLHADNPERLDALETAFRQEALVAACLEHPHILPVHDLGMGADGHLLLATKLVHGKPWDALIEATSRLPVPEFLDTHLPILEDVAQAVAFAHASGIVHRDLKPSQVMVGQFGEVLLMDWGIAMFAGEAPPAVAAWPALAPYAPTRATASNPAGTAAYMAPEQTLGSVDAIGPWTDVYLLGGILYELLTGHFPHEARTHAQSFARASRGIVPNPWEAAPGREIPSELAALALACLQPAPADRLPSAEHFLAQLGDYRASASRHREAERLLRRAHEEMHRARDYESVARCQSLAARALVLWPEFEAAARLEEELALRHARLAIDNMDLKLARQQVERLSGEGAERRALVAEIDRLEDEQARSRERLEEAHRRTREAHSRADRLVSFLLQDLHTSLQSVNRLDLMARVGREALEYFESLADEEQTPESTAKRAIACRNIGDVFKGQGNVREAEAAYRNFHELASRLVATVPQDRQGPFLLAESLERRSSVKYLMGNLTECLRLLDEAFELACRIQLETADDPETSWLAARISHQKGVALWRRRSLEAALGCQTASLATLESLSAAFPERTDFRVSIGWNLSTLGNVYRDLSNLELALSTTRRAVDVRRALFQEDPENKSRLDDFGWSLTNLALLQEYTGDFDGALAMYAEAEAWRRRLFNEDPTNAIHRNTMAFLLSSQGRNLYGLGRLREAAMALSEACSISRSLVESDPTNTREAGGHALNVAYAGLAALAVGERGDARAHLAEAAPLAARALKSVPENGVFQNAWCQARLLEGILARDDGDADRARACWSEAAALLETQAWRNNTGQGAGLHLELCLLLGRRADAEQDAAVLRARRWMLPRWEELLRGERES